MAEKNRIQALKRAFGIVDALSELQAAGVSELADHLDVPKSTVHVYLQTLEEEGYLLNSGGTYRLSHRFLEIGGELRHSSSLFQGARQEVDSLSTETGEVANLGVEEDGKRVLLYTAQPPEGMFDNSPTGQYTLMHQTALGKALLSQMSDDDVERVLDRHGLPAATDRTITERDSLLAELNDIREKGYSIEDEERREGIKAIAVPLQHEADDGEPVSAVSISGPKRRISASNADQTLVEALRDTANVIELKYKHY
jgi:DNA-binding IclR family transcriptional regulator